MYKKYHIQIVATPSYIDPKTHDWLLNNYGAEHNAAPCSDPDCDCIVSEYVFEAETLKDYAKLISIIDNSFGHVRMYKTELVESKKINSLES